MKILTLLFFLFASGIVFSQKTHQIRIFVKDNNINNGISGATIKILKYEINTKSDANGWVILNQTPVGRFEIEVSAEKYQSVILKELLLTTAKELVLEIGLEPEPKNLKEVKIIANSPNLSSAILGIQTISTEQIFRYPATFLDPARLAFNLPGVSNTNDQANGMSIRGNAPEGLQWRLEGVEIVNPNHLSNAGTFSDKPTQTAGGTNILSAQMLGNMNFLSGTFPADYGNAQSGVMDMRFREGNAQKYENTAQVGLLGIDLSIEGPLNKRSGSSYLINYRYSFTGIMGLMGIKFGGEKIAFQDLSFNLNFPTKHIGTFSAFFMGGNSSNVFAPNANKSSWTSDKDLNNIDFYSKMAVLGVKHYVLLKNKWLWQSVFAQSGLENLRNAYTQDPNFNVNYDYNQRKLISGASTISGKVFTKLNFKSGLNFTSFINRYNYLDSDQKFYNIRGFSVQPFVRFTNGTESKLNFNLGLIGMYYRNAKYIYAEPRMAFSYRLHKTKLKAAYGLHSHQINSRFTNNFDAVILRSHQFSVGSLTQLNANLEFTTEFFYQNIFNIPVALNDYSSILNGIDAPVYTSYGYKNGNSGRNYGFEMNFKRYLNQGFFALINSTIYKSEFLAFDHKYYLTRFSGNTIFNVTVGKEWQRKNGNLLGINTRINYLGGFRNYEINLAASKTSATTIYDYSHALLLKNQAYFRPDLRVYLKILKTKNTKTISLDLQNVINRQNMAYQYFDSFKNTIIDTKQLGLIPMLNYRWEF